MTMHLLHIFQKIAQVKRCVLLQKLLILTRQSRFFLILSNNSNMRRLDVFLILLLKCHSSVHAPFLQQAKVCSAERAYLCCTMYACPLDEDTIAALIHTHCALRPHTIILIKSAERLHAGGCDKQHCILNGDNKRGAACCAPLMIFTIRYPLILLRNLPPYTLRYSPHP